MSEMTGIGSMSDDWDAGVCRANGIDIRYQRSGTDRPTVIALHGLTGSGDCLKPLARSLIKDFDVILPDARGHGASSMSEAVYSYDQLAADVIGLIVGLKLRAPVLLGHSMGGNDGGRGGARARFGDRRARPGRPDFHQPGMATRGV
ncbi:alpha/beta fold hydrolase [Sphingobium sp. 3R8]|uniref:alpha/beta fold hydrolase n=1 Tax=Sphingobium sp. 3R8 TaxID=2874921 RepID=UPI001CCDFDAC|nr:alpha/beta fold hydrolase [Sphingobium sp. 3R8]MBZ9648109.1 alpha/beta fold hydrolase [Sphingobium sp. 3R8]